MIRKETNNIEQINFIGGRFLRGSKDRCSGNDKDDENSRRKIQFALKTKDLLEPNYFVRDTPTLSRKQYQKLSFLGAHLIGKSSVPQAEALSGA